MKSLLAAPRRALLLLIVVVALLLAAPTTYALTRTPGGGDVPFYARIQREHVFHTNEWAAIVFYRPPECVPDTFNLLDLFDPMNAFGCGPATTDGFTIWTGEPGISFPIHAQLHGLGAVPVWFVAWEELQAAMADDSLTVPELEALPSLLIGSASFYHETLHPSEGAVVPMINYEAHGMLADGRSFRVHVTLVTISVTNVSIEFE